MPSADDVAQWMLTALNAQGGYLAQEDAAYEIQRRFGEQFTYYNENGNPAIRRDVLAAFRKMTEKSVVWMRSERAWRRRETGDPAGRQAE